MREKYYIEGFVDDLRLITRPITIGEHEYKPDETKAFVEFTLLHSYPKVNSNGCTFFLPLLSKCIGTAKFQPLNKEHQLEGNPDEIFEGENKIIGSMIAVRLPETANSDGEIPLIPEKPIPVKVVAVLWKRIKDVQGILDDVENGIEWKVSMEVIRDPSRDAFVVGEKIYRSWDDVYGDIYTAWKSGDLYDGEKIAIALGGTGLEEEDEANFWGGATTFQPADDGATFDSLVAAIASDGTFPILKRAPKTSKPEEGDIMASKIIIGSDGTIKETKLELNGKDVGELQSISLYGDQYGGDEHFGLNWAQVERDGDAIKTINYSYDPETGSIKQEETQMDIVKQIEQLLSNSETKYDGWISPDKVEETVKEKLAERVAEFESYLSPEQVEQKIGEALENYKSELKIFAGREKELRDADLKLTPERAEKLQSFALDEDGNKECNEYIATLKIAVESMKSLLKEKDIDATDEILSQIAKYDGVEDSRFTDIVVVATSLKKEKKSFLPAFGLGVDTGDGEKSTKKYLH